MVSSLTADCSATAVRTRIRSPAFQPFSSATDRSTTTSPSPGSALRGSNVPRLTASKNAAGSTAMTGRLSEGWRLGSSAPAVPAARAAACSSFACLVSRKFARVTRSGLVVATPATPLIFSSTL